MYVCVYVCVFAIFRQADPVQPKAGWIVGLYQQWQDQNTTPGTTFPTLCKKSVGSLMSPARQYKVHAEDGAPVYRSYLRR